MPTFPQYILLHPHIVFILSTILLDLVDINISTISPRVINHLSSYPWHTAHQYILLIFLPAELYDAGLLIENSLF